MAKKYIWGEGRALPDLDEHSQTKHLIVSEYIKLYIATLMSDARIEQLDFTLVDAFAGGGAYNSALSGAVVDGSPILMLKAVKEAEFTLNIDRIKPRRVNADYHFVESDKAGLEFLKNVVAGSEFASSVGKSIFFYRKKFIQALAEIIEKIQLRNKTRRAIFLLDQYAYKDVPFWAVRDILSKTNGEVILTFNFDSLQAYISDTERNKKALANIGLADHISWERLGLLKEAGCWAQAIQEQLANAIHKCSGAKHITLFFLAPKDGWAYWLVHLSNVYRARDVMMGLHWKHSNTSFRHHLKPGLFTLGYEAVEVPGQNSLLMEKFDFGAKAQSMCIDALSKDLPKFICDRKEDIRFNDLLDLIGSNTPASEVELRKGLEASINNKEIVVLTPKGNLRRSVNGIDKDDILRYHQGQIFLP